MPFVPVAAADDITVGQGTFVERDGVSLAVFNAGAGRFYACSALCPHEDGPLAEGWLEGTSVVCPWHGFNFDVTTGACGVDDALSVAVYATRVRAGTVEVDVP
jgi:nitrite reductase/ring-hydroxylating ferredoxin subunit